MADAPDPYGIDFVMDATGDLVVTQAGQLETVSGPPNCVQALAMRARTWPGDLELHPEYGSLLQPAVGGKMNVLALQGRAQDDLNELVGQDRRFVAARDVTAGQVAQPDGSIAPTTAQVSATIYLAGGEQLRVANLQSPGIDDAVTPAQADLADLSTVSDFLDFTFITADDQELTDLQDAQSVNALVSAFGSDTDLLG